MKKDIFSRIFLVVGIITFIIAGAFVIYTQSNPRVTSIKIYDYYENTEKVIDGNFSKMLRQLSKTNDGTVEEILDKELKYNVYFYSDENLVANLVIYDDSDYCWFSINGKNYCNKLQENWYNKYLANLVYVE